MSQVWLLLLCLSFVLFQQTSACATNCTAACKVTSSCKASLQACQTEAKKVCANPPKAFKDICNKTDPCQPEFEICKKTVAAVKKDCHALCRDACTPPVSNSTAKTYKKRQDNVVALKSLYAEIQAAKALAIKNFQYCYKDTYWRGSRVADCPSGYTNLGATCSRGADTIYTPSRVADCPSGYTNTGATCFRGEQTYGKCCTTLWSSCPCAPGWTNMGCHCAIHANTLGMGSMTCRSGEFRTGGRCYKICPSGYTNTGETCFRPVSTLGMDAMTCRLGESKTGARCYPNCNSGFNGELDTCWMICPSAWTNCGMSCSKEGTAGCVEKIGMTIFDGVLAAGSIAAMIVTGGASGAATAAANAARYAAAAEKGRKLLKTFQEFQKAYEAIDVATKVGTAAQEIGIAASEGSALFTTIVVVNQLVNLLTIVDPTGLSSLALNLMAPKCNRLEQDWVVFSILG